MALTNLQFYTLQKTETESKIELLSNRLKWYALYRFVSFVGIFLPVFLYSAINWLAFSVCMLFLIVFLFLVKKNSRLEKQKKYQEVLNKLISEEIKALDHQFIHFENGNEFIDPDHYFSYDLDLFGEGSLFQFLNRASTVSGKSKLAVWLNNPLVIKQDILNRQEAVRELSGKIKWRLDFLTQGKLFHESAEQAKELLNWSAMDLEIKRPRLLKLLIWFLPSLTVLSVVLSFVGIPAAFIWLFVLSQWVVFIFNLPQINRYFKFFGKKSELLSKYMQLLNVIEKADFKSGYLQKIQNKIVLPQKSSEVFSQLKSLVKEFEYRQNMVVGALLNSFLLWDVRCVVKLWMWHTKHHKNLAQWLMVIAEVDALISLANYAGNHPEFVYPEIGEDEFVFSTQNLGHPLLKPIKRIANNFEISGWSKVSIITGANMAGKSTFLRTVGVNLILAGIGVPVCATKMKFTPIVLYTNMRTTDSLLKDESYFFAELKRLKGVLDRLRNGEAIFVILDEMLKGTNSIDKLNGSREIIRKLVELTSVTLIATHDLKLSEMEQEFPDKVSNKCFEIKIENEELVFDYKLSDGVTQTMNATFLMKKMGII